MTEDPLELLIAAVEEQQKALEALTVLQNVHVADGHIRNARRNLDRTKILHAQQGKQGKDLLTQMGAAFDVDISALLNGLSGSTPDEGGE